jgi:hypothetical protein
VKEEKSKAKAFTSDFIGLFMLGAMRPYLTNRLELGRVAWAFSIWRKISKYGWMS